MTASDAGAKPDRSMPTSPPGVLVFGGTFDPPHFAHAMLPPVAARQLGCDRILYVPAAMNPLKDEQPTAAEHRLAMLRLALADVPNATICTLELDRSGPSYTVDTLERLREQLEPDVSIRLLMGVDAALSFPWWREPDRILDLATPAVMIRPPWTELTWRREIGERLEPRAAERWRSWTVAVPRMDISASEVRRRLACDRALTDLVPPAVLEYIRAHGLYPAGAGGEPLARDLDVLAAEAREHVPEIAPPALRSLLERGLDDLLLIDVREPDEWADGRIEGATHLPRGVLERDVAERCFPRGLRPDDLDRPIVLYCGGGRRSALAGRQLQRMGFRNVRSLRGGYDAWQSQRSPAGAHDLSSGS